MESLDVSVVIPAYNEEKAIEKVITDIEKALNAGKRKYEIIVVDDGSTDETPSILKKIQGIELIVNDENRGYGAALKRGIKKSRGNIIIITDADGTYPNKDIPRLLEYADQYDMVVGARTGKNVKIPLYRRPAKWFLTKLANYLSESKIPDLNSGMRTFKRDTILQFFNILPSGFSFTTTITLAYLNNDYSVKYVPIDYHSRKGESKIRPVKDTLGFISLIIRTITYFNPLKVFLPVGLALFAAAIAVFAYSTFILGKFMDVATVVLVVASIQVCLFGLLADLVVRRSEHK